MPSSWSMTALQTGTTMQAVLKALRQHHPGLQYPVIHVPVSPALRERSGQRQ
jgi:predicted phosphoribosyltransferase